MYSKWMFRPAGSSKYLANCLATDMFLFWSGAEAELLLLSLLGQKPQT